MPALDLASRSNKWARLHITVVAVTPDDDSRALLDPVAQQLAGLRDLGVAITGLLPELVDVAEIERRTGLRREVVTARLASPHIRTSRPASVNRAGRRRPGQRLLWNWSEVDSWLCAYLPGRAADDTPSPTAAELDQLWRRLQVASPTT